VGQWKRTESRNGSGEHGELIFDNETKINQSFQQLDTHKPENRKTTDKETEGDLDSNLVPFSKSNLKNGPET
jgi:hypothetical protein